MTASDPKRSLIFGTKTLASEDIELTCSGVLDIAGSRYWTASLLPALAGTTLPFWLRPANFSIWWFGAIAFLIATVLFHAGFSLLRAGLGGLPTVDWPRSRLLKTGGICIIASCFLGLQLNQGLKLHSGVPDYIFIVYGICVLFVGALYVVPPLNFCRRAGGEIILAKSLGFMPVLGAYLIQVGDITRKVYVAAVPLIIVTGLWVWIGELITRKDDEIQGRGTLVRMFGPRFSGRWVVPGLVILLYSSIVLAVISGTYSAFALLALLSIGTAKRVTVYSWHEYANPTAMLDAHKATCHLHLTVGIVVLTSSLLAP